MHRPCVDQRSSPLLRPDETGLSKLRDKPPAARSCTSSLIICENHFVSLAGSISPSFPKCFLACADQYFMYLFWSFALSNYTLMPSSLKKVLPAWSSPGGSGCYGEQQQITWFFTRSRTKWAWNGSCDIFPLQLFRIWSRGALTKSKSTVLFIIHRVRQRTIWGQSLRLW